VGAFVRETGKKVKGMANFIKEALDKVFTEGNEFPSVTYETPQAVVKYMEMQSAFGNPPWKIKRKK
jgi:hypothetical protein